MELRVLVDPRRTALLSMEMQRGVVGDLSGIGPLVAAIEAGGVIANTAMLAAAAREAGVQLVHCNAAFRADRKGSAINCPILGKMTKNPQHMLLGSPAVEVVPEIGVEAKDMVSLRLHGMSPFSGTELNTLLRNLGVQTVVAMGVSVNIGVFGLVVEAIGLGYNVVVVRDCVAGFPLEYADAIIDNSLSALAKVVTAAEVAECWQKSS